MMLQSKSVFIIIYLQRLSFNLKFSIHHQVSQQSPSGILRSDLRVPLEQKTKYIQVFILILVFFSYFYCELIAAVM